MIDAKRLLWRLPADAAHAALLCQQAFVLFLEIRRSVRAGAKNPIAFPAAAPLALLDLLLVDRVIGAMLRLPISMFQVFRIALPSLCIPSTSVASQCHFPQSSRPVGPDLAIKRHAPTTGGGRRRSKSESVETGFCEWHAINARRRIAMQPSQLRRDLCGRADAMSRRAGKRKINARPAHPAKAFRPGMLEP